MTSHSNILADRRTTFARLCRVAAALVVLAAGLAAQAFYPVSYGDQAWQGTIATAGQIDTFLLGAAPGTPCQQNDILRVTFCSASSGYPSYVQHRLDMWDGTTNLGTVQGSGPLTLTLPATNFFRITVRAQNGQWTGWYAFQVDRLNDPVGADRIAFAWNLNGRRSRGTNGAPVNLAGITRFAEFAVYTLHAEAGSSGTLALSAPDSGYPSYVTHYAELLDPTGQRLVRVDGTQSAAVSFPTTDTYVLFVAAQNYTFTGWYRVSVGCQSWPLTMCDGTSADTAFAGNYGAGTPGTNGVVPSLSATPPVLGGTFDIAIGNSYAQPAPALLLWGLSANYSTVPSLGNAFLLVGGPSVLDLTPLPPAGTIRTIPLPDSPFLSGYGIAVQAVVADPAVATAPYGAAFSRGLLVLLGR